VSALANRLAAAWYGDAPPPAWARATESLYRAAVRLRRGAYRRGWLPSGHPGRPVVVVGNLTAGGAGKTPLVIWLLRSLAERGYSPAAVSRGYGGAEPRSPHRVNAGDDPAHCGDEPLMIAADTGLPVWVCRDRLAAARAAVAAGANLVIADDGLQHYRLQRDFEIAVVDGERGLGNGRCLPAGPLREPAARLAEVDLVVCNGTGRAPRAPWSWSWRRPRQPASTVPSARPLAQFAPGPVHAIAGIGHPERFFRLLERHDIELIRHPLPDHGRVPLELLSPADGRPVLMTAKDAARCARVPAAARAWQLPVEAHFADGGQRLLEALASYGGLREA
jgi:tetraacyldisaccharide 4'-kinase